ncbi:MAG: hypothetical protein ISN29_02380, partial [Gammaproteobacteria bacterium AqS3]|nr:hypothetical protein [Gammaproteobacteria bacterium AqS3]
GNAIVDGSQIILTFDRELKASAETGTLGWWDITVGGSARNITKQITYQNKAFLTMASHVDHDDVVTIGYDASDVGSGKTGIIDLSGITSLDFTIPASNIINQTTNGLPSIPADFRAFKTGTDMVKAMWESNYNGGQTIDGYEYGISYDNGTTWSEWIALASGTREVELSPNTVSQLPNRIRARASNPNAQTLQKLGFTGLNALAPITRPVEHRLTVVVTLSQASQLVRDALNEIKTVLVNRVNQYSMGETIWVNDLLAVAELVQGARITNISVTHGGTDVNDVEQPAFVNWKLEAGDITFA